MQFLLDLLLQCSSLVLLFTYVFGIAMVLIERKDKRWLNFLLLLAVVTLGKGILYGVFQTLRTVVQVRYDQYFYLLDGIWGEPSFLLGQFLFHHPVIRCLSFITYYYALNPMLVLMIAYCMGRPQREFFWLVRAYAINFALSPLIYLMLPVAGPMYSFKEFPWTMPLVSAPHVFLATSIPNGIPSVHMSTALLDMHFAGRWKTGRTLSPIWIILTVIATLGFGEHYVFDLIVAIPYAALVIWLAAYRKKLVHIENSTACPGIGKATMEPCKPLLPFKSNIGDGVNRMAATCDVR